ncbi:hypothetical protein HPB50_016416 [Hyalomma asiaticum]|uniref:Uncharacterized protein n=1 Tax=Hyalomma asiaticum TaxID=266040 RepID=A0ACB7SWT3_HYAAI|nr:hypothetical protein HPB50_016416 [Hyalomma asiaticum]
MPSDTSSTWNENVYDDVEVPESNKSYENVYDVVEVPESKKSYLYVHNRDGLAEISYESVPDQDSVETTTSRGNKELAVSSAEKDSAVVPAEKSKKMANSTKRSPGSEEEHIYEDIDAVRSK